MWPRGIIEVNLYMGEGGPNVTITHDAIGLSQVTRNPPPTPTMLKLVHLGTLHLLVPVLALAPPDLFKLVHYVVQTSSVCKLAIGIRFKCLLVVNGFYLLIFGMPKWCVLVLRLLI